jgi:glycosyltransferase involved in cell wall biosynthesis
VSRLARKKLGIKNQSKIFGYVGTLKTMGMEKGVATAIRCLKNLPVEYSLYVVGGEKEDIEYYKKISDNEGISDRVIFAGKVSHGDVPLHISACDCLVAPFPENEHYSYFMSPLKIFEYMASKRPMVVSDLPSLREVLRDGDTALFIRPDNSADLAQAILKVCSDTDLYKKLSENAYKDVLENYTWKKRAEKILSFIRLKI